MVSLKTKNPFGGSLELFSLSTWIGLGAGAVVVGVFWVMVSGVTKRVEEAGSPIDMLHKRLEGLGA